MTTEAIHSIFIDTNILVYANLTSSPFHQEARQAVRTLQSTNRDLWINRQVLREYLAVVTRQTFAAPLPPAQATNDIQLFEQMFAVADETSEVTKELLSLLQTIPSSGKQVHDANIVATMLVHKMDALLTHNVSDFKRFDHLITVLPLIPENTPPTTEQKDNTHGSL